MSWLRFKNWAANGYAKQPSNGRLKLPSLHLHHLPHTEGRLRLSRPRRLRLLALQHVHDAALIAEDDEILIEIPDRWCQVWLDVAIMGSRKMQMRVAHATLRN